MHGLMKYIPNAASMRVGRQLLLGQKHSPTILFAGGVVGIIATTVMSSRATLKLNVTLEATAENLEKAKTLHESEHPDYSTDDYRKDVGILYARAVVDVTKLYAPAFLVGAASIAALTGSHKILTSRNAALTAAYAALDTGFREYRQRVVKEFGPEVDQKLRYNAEERTETQVTPNGSSKEVKVLRAGPDNISIYARFFDDGSASWSRVPEYNFLFLRCQQNYANDLLKSRGHLFLNEVYDFLGIERSRAGAVVGWVISKDSGDNYVDFGIFDGNNPRARDFVNGREGSILLDFNVDGVIYDKI